MTPKYSELTPCQFASNRPIDGNDLDGLEFIKKSIYHYNGKNLETVDFRDVWVSDVRAHNIAVLSNPGPLNSGQAPGDLDHTDEGSKTVKSYADNQGSLGGWADEAHNNYWNEKMGLSTGANKHKAMGAVDATGFFRDVGMTISAYIYNKKYDKEIRLAINSAGAFDKALDLIGTAEKNHLFPEDMPASVKVGVMNWLIDGQNKAGDASYQMLIGAWGTLLYEHQSEVNDGTLVTIPKLVTRDARGVDATMIRTRPLYTNQSNPAAKFALDKWEEYKKLHPNYDTPVMKQN